jgi:PadR family transcriptional regulator PadR
MTMARRPDAVSELRRGALELALLAFLDREPSFSGAILDGLAEATNGGMALTEGSLYPALGRLEKNGMLEPDWRKEVEGRRARKYYSLTEAGRERLEQLSAAWAELADGMQKLIGGGD